LGIVLTGAFVDDGTLFEQSTVQTGMALCRSYETDVSARSYVKANALSAA
jgi:hypothetical protein